MKGTNQHGAHGLRGRHLQFKLDKLYGREHQLNQLWNVYEKLSLRNVCGQSKDEHFESPIMAEIVLVSGYSGVGKSSLVYKFRDMLSSKASPSTSDRVPKPCWFISGAFESLKTTPYSAILQAFSGYCVQLINRQDHEELCRVADGIKKAVGNEGKVLTDMIPQLTRLIGKQQSEASTATNSMNRLKFLFQAFVEAISCSGCPLVLFLDDLQRADSTSLELVTALMTTPTLAGKFLLIGSFRSNEVGAQHPLAVALDKMEQKRQSAPEKLQLSNLTVEAMNEFVADTLHLDPEETWSLTNSVYRKTDGNIFYTMQLLEQLNEKDALRYDCSLAFQWVWDADRIHHEMDMTDNVVDVVAARITNLPQQLQTTLSIAGLIGKSFDLQIVQEFIVAHYPQAILQKSVYYDYDLVELLDMAVEEGLLELEAMGSTMYRFSHDRIQQAACSRLPSEENKDLQKQIGKYLAGLVFRGSGEDWMMFVAADHLNATLFYDTAPTYAEMVSLATLNLTVGKRAVSLSAFVPSYSYFRKGLDVIARLPGESPWLSNYNLTLELHRGTIDSELSIGDFDRGWTLAHELLDNVEDLSDKLPTYASLVFALMRRERCKEAIELALETIQLLGECPKRLQFVQALKSYFFTKKAFRQHTDEEVLSLPVMTDPYKVKAMELMGLVLYNAFMAQDMALFVLTVFRQVRLTFEVGMCGPSAFAFSCYGIVLCGRLEDHKLARRMGMLALEILELTKEKRFRAAVHFSVAAFIDPWFVPLSSVMATLHKGHIGAMETGDFDMGFRTFFQYQVMAYAAGTPLDKLEQDGRRLLDLMNQYNVDSIRSVFDQYQLAVLSLTGSRIAVDWREPYPAANRSLFGRLWNIFSRMQLAYFFEDMSLADEMSTLAIKELLGASHTFIFVSHTLFFASLIAMRQVLETGRRKHWTRVRKLRKHFAKMRRTKGFNILHKSFIVEAQFLAISHGSRKEDEVRAAFDKAIAASSRAGFTQDLAIANELAGEFFVRVNDRFWAKHYLSHAYQEYQCWKAHAKVKHLLQKHGAYIDVSNSLFNSTSLLKKRHSIQGDACNKHMSVNLEGLRGRRGYVSMDANLP